MPLTPQDLHAIQAAVAPVIGREAWGVHLGYGGRLTLCFGQDRSATRTLRSGQQWVETREEWILWTDSVMWRLEDTHGVLTAWEDPRPIMAAAIAQLNGRRLRSVEIAPLSAGHDMYF